MADLPITALTTAGQLSSSDLLYVAIPNPLSPIGFSLCKMTSAQFGLFLNNQLLFASDLDTDSKTIIGAINELKAGGGGASVIQLTAAEYAELTPAEKINGSIYKLTDKAIFYCLNEEYHAVKELTSAQYEALTSAEQNNGTIYIQTDAETTAADIPYSTGVSVKDKLDNLANLFLTHTYTATKTVSANGVVALLGSDMGYNSIPAGYTPIAYTFACTNSNDLFCNLNSIMATGASQFAVIRNVSTGAQNDKVCNITITFIKSDYLTAT